jgi:hypothetical protein
MTYRGVEGEWKHVLHAVKRDVIWSVLRSLAQLANPVSQLPPTPTPHTRPSPLTLSSPSPRGNLLAYAPLLSPTPAAGSSSSMLRSRRAAKQTAEGGASASAATPAAKGPYRDDGGGGSDGGGGGEEERSERSEEADAPLLVSRVMRWPRNKGAHSAAQPSSAEKGARACVGAWV